PAAINVYEHIHHTRREQSNGFRTSEGTRPAHECRDIRTDDGQDEEQIAAETTEAKINALTRPPMHSLIPSRLGHGKPSSLPQPPCPRSAPQGTLVSPTLLHPALPVQAGPAAVAAVRDTA